MKRIGLISDTHGYFDEKIACHFKNCDEIWHAGDFGSYQVVEQLKSIKPLRGVYGNIDGNDIKAEFGEKLFFEVEDVRVFIQHIGGYPGRYVSGVRDVISYHKVNLFISGHSHILKIIYDNVLQCLHINPGAAGKQGWQKVRTLIRLVIDGNAIKDCEVIELGKR